MTTHIKICALFLALALVLPVAWAEDATYISNSTCKVCHNKAKTGEQWKVWKSMSHAKAFEALKTPEAVAAAKERGIEKPPHEAPECLTCHGTGYDVKEKKAPEKIKPEDGVQCESCHGPGSLHKKDGAKVMQKKEVDITAHIIRPDAKVCTKCHNDESPSWNPEKYTLEDGKKVGFDFKQASKKIAPPNPEKAKAE